MRRGTSPAVLAGVALALIGLSGAGRARPPAALARTGAGESASRLESLLCVMTLEEKIGQMALTTSDWDVTGPSMRADYLDGIAKGKVGAILNAYTTAHTRKLQTLALEKSRLKIPLLFGYDVIHGHRTIFPIPLGEAASFDLAAIERSARIAATEAAAEGIDWTFAPMVDIARDARWGRIAEGAGEDVYLACRVARARVKGFQGSDLAAPDAVLACAKHFAAYGAAEAGRDYNTVDMSPERLWSVYLPPFKAAVDAGVGTVMTAFNDVNGIPATANEYLHSEVLRRRWGFEGFVVSDYTAINEMVPHGYAKDESDAGRRAVLAGVDLDMQGGIFARHLEVLVATGQVPLKTIDDAVRRILRMKARLGLFEDPFRRCDAAREKSVVMRASHLAAARQIAGESIVLLRNEQALLPLGPRSGSIAVIGPLADDTHHYLGPWSAAGDAKRCTSVLAALRSRSRSRVRYAKGCAITGEDRSGFARALAVAADAGVVVAVMGEGSDMSGEAASRSELGLPGVQRELLERLHDTRKPIVLVLMNGRPLAIAWEARNIPAILETWFAGTMAGPAIADVIFGDINPSAKLPVTFPRSVGQVPIYYSVKNTGRPFHPEDPAAKYVSRYLDVPNTPLFPFGYGLSYTTYAYGIPRPSRTAVARTQSCTVAVDVTNTGRRGGDEIVQLYLRHRVGALAPSVLELKGFQRVSLAPGERRTVEFTLRPEDFASLQRDLSMQVEPGEVQILTGPSSASLQAAMIRLVD